MQEIINLILFTILVSTQLCLFSSILNYKFVNFSHNFENSKKEKDREQIYCWNFFKKIIANLAFSLSFAFAKTSDRKE